VEENQHQQDEEKQTMTATTTTTTTTTKSCTPSTAKRQSNMSNKRKAVGIGDEEVPTASRLDARSASQFYRDKAKRDFDVLVSASAELRERNTLLRSRLIETANAAGLKARSALSLPPAPKHTDVTSKQARKSSVPYRQGETRKERNRRAAKNSRENAKKRITTAKEENAALAADNAQLASRLATFGVAVAVVMTSAAAAAANKTKKHVSDKRRKVSQHESVRLISEAGVFSLLLMCGAIALLCQCDDAVGNRTQYVETHLNAQRMGMSMGRGLQIMTMSGKRRDAPVFASFVCVASMAAGVLALWRHRTSGTHTGSATDDPMIVASPAAKKRP
jgi:hypothetical protein